MQVGPDQYAVMVRWKENNRRVVAVAEKDGNEITVDGDLKGVHERGILIRPKGRTVPEMIDMGDLKSLVLHADIPKPIAQKRVSGIPFGMIRQHLADRHGISIDELNSKGYDENKAYDFHLAEHSPGQEKMSHYHEG